MLPAFFSVWLLPRQDKICPVVFLLYLKCVLMKPHKNTLILRVKMTSVMTCSPWEQVLLPRHEMNAVWTRRHQEEAQHKQQHPVHFQATGNISFKTWGTRLFIQSKCREMSLYTETKGTVFTKHLHHSTVSLLCNSFALESNSSAAKECAANTRSTAKINNNISNNKTQKRQESKQYNASPQWRQKVSQLQCHLQGRFQSGSHAGHGCAQWKKHW